MTARSRLDRVEADIQRAAFRHRGSVEILIEPMTADELREAIEDREDHPRPVMPWGGGPLTADHYAVEELREIAAFELEHPLGGGRQ